MLFESIPAINHITAEGANVIWNAWKSGGQSNAGAFGGAAAQVFKAGYLGDATILNTGDSRAAALTTTQKYAIYQQGRKVGQAETKAKQANVNAAYKQAKETLEQTGKKKGAYGASLDVGIEQESMTDRQRTVYEYADSIAKGVQTNVRVYDGKGKEQGYYNPKTDEIWLNLNAANSGREAILAFTLSHELVHRSKKGSPLKYQAFVDFLMKEYGKQGADVDAMIAEQLAAVEEYNKTVPADQ